MTTLYITQPGAEVRKHGGRLRVASHGQLLSAIPLREVERVVLLGPVQVSAAAIKELLQREIPVFFCTQKGKHYGTLSTGIEDVERWLIQVERWRDEDYRLTTAKAIVGAKARHQRSLIRRHARNYGDPQLTETANQLTRMVETLEMRSTVPEVMGVEGQTSALYFGVFGLCLRQEGITFTKRSKHPSTDPVNALLSLGYMLVLGEVVTALMSQGLHPGLGFLHEPSRKRPALALDVLELFRQPIVDRLTLSLFNRGVFTPEDFESQPTGSVLLKPENLKRYLELYERTLTTSFRHPQGEHQTTYRDLIREQTSDLRSKLLTGETWSPLTLEL